jgi:hypothetical protein
MNLETNSAGKQEILPSGGQGRTLVARTWFGRTRRESADEYLRYNYENGVLEVEKKPGCLGMQQFRKIRGDVAEFTTISYWSSMEAMEAAHGEPEPDAPGGGRRVPARASRIRRGQRTPRQRLAIELMVLTAVTKSSGR